ncbi:MAG: NADH-quinone oxidoreductase subunit A [Bergeyella sp.]|nr:NADH-quinone oxidoreductase subunit A [Bergeyella sp.]
MNLPSDYLPILIQAAVALAFIAVSLLGAHFLGPKQKKNAVVKNQTFECGVKVEGNARTPFSIKYFLTAILFVLFDIEIIFFYPYVLNFREFGIEGFLAVLTFVSIFFMGFLYVLRRGALDWSN